MTTKKLKYVLAFSWFSLLQPYLKAANDFPYLACKVFLKEISHSQNGLPNSFSEMGTVSDPIFNQNLRRLLGDDNNQAMMSYYEYFRRELLRPTHSFAVAQAIVLSRLSRHRWVANRAVSDVAEMVGQLDVAINLSSDPKEIAELEKSRRLLRTLQLSSASLDNSLFQYQLMVQELDLNSGEAERARQNILKLFEIVDDSDLISLDEAQIVYLSFDRLLQKRFDQNSQVVIRPDGSKVQIDEMVPYFDMKLGAALLGSLSDIPEFNWKARLWATANPLYWDLALKHGSPTIKRQAKAQIDSYNEVQLFIDESGRRARELGKDLYEKKHFEESDQAMKLFEYVVEDQLHRIKSVVYSLTNNGNPRDIGQVKNKKGTTLLEFARLLGRAEIVTYLEELRNQMQVSPSSRVTE